ncbi:serine/threonine-protein phosphatase 2A activator1 [Striga asiatica]|uniref:Serine/threonine-protein phosphatase 2A activator1 n=1 Tax=Striga asiatica TaxID=4170 RepID=A0A5A7NV19_STRAF|nr:serine/threonine-protein phosphatase 2A activator1 [Striga asiatica]
MRHVLSDVNLLTFRRDTWRILIGSRVHRLPTHSVNLGKRIVHVCRIECGGLHEVERLALGKRGPGVSRDGHEVSEVGFVADEHHDRARVRVVAKLFEPPLDALERRVPRHVVNEEGAHGPAVVRARDGTTERKRHQLPKISTSIKKVAYGLQKLGRVSNSKTLQVQRIMGLTASKLYFQHLLMIISQ